MSPPTGGISSRVPSEKRTTSSPTRGDSTSPPTGGTSSRAPSEERTTSSPTRGDSTRNPGGGHRTRDPTEGKGQRDTGTNHPHNGGDAPNKSDDGQLQGSRGKLRGDPRPSPNGGRRWTHAGRGPQEERLQEEEIRARGRPRGRGPRAHDGTVPERRRR